MDAHSDTVSLEQSLTLWATRLVHSDLLDVYTRKALQKASQKLSLALETPGDTFERIAFLVKPRVSDILLWSSSHTYHIFSCCSASPNHSRSYCSRSWLVPKARTGRTCGQKHTRTRERHGCRPRLAWLVFLPSALSRIGCQY